MLQNKSMHYPISKLKTAHGVQKAENTSSDMTHKTLQLAPLLKNTEEWINVGCSLLYSVSENRPFLPENRARHPWEASNPL